MITKDRAIHSDIIVHWTGSDIDKKFDKDWDKNNYSMTNDEITAIYLYRLKNILKFGLWVTKNEEDKYVEVDGNKIKRPWVSRTCFTELRLSEVRNHAKEYGRLGIGFKRFFLFDRLGCPMVYYPLDRENWFFPPYMSTKENDFFRNYYSCFLKPMYKKPDSGTLNYSFYDESEWRIIYSDKIEKELIKLNKDELVKKFKKFILYTEKEQEEILKSKIGNIYPEYLMPLKEKEIPSNKFVNNCWLSFIVYPSIKAKVISESDSEIRKLIEELKPFVDLKTINNYYCQNIDKPGPFEPFSKPIEIDLDACRNF